MAKEHLGRWVGNISDSPGGDPPEYYSMYDGDDRDAVLEALRQFCERLDFRLEMFTGRDPAMVEVFDADVSLRAEMIGQKVHTFIGRELVEPVVTALGYEYIAEPRRSRPELKQGRENIYPDFRLIPRQPGTEIPPDIIGEIKPPGGGRRAVKELRTEYMSKIEAPAYGIATDGITWYGLERLENETAPLPVVSQVPLRVLLHRIRREIVHERATYDIDRLRTSDELNRFIGLFEQIPG